MKLRLFTLLLASIFTFAASAQTVLYGLARGTQGSIIKYDFATDNITPVANLAGLPWYNDLIEYNGELYGMTESGGDNGYGMIFSYKPGMANYSKLYSFKSSDGASPYGSLLVNAATGTFYSMTKGGGTNNHGVIFSFKPGASNPLTVLHSFAGSGGGRAPHGNLLLASDGKLYGMTESGGANDYGTIFSINPNGSSFTVHHSFSITSGRSPYGSLVQANGGLLYGMTQFGGDNGYGVLFSFDPISKAYSPKFHFDWANGAWPNSTLIKAADGNLYGTTESGGNNYGTVFSYTPGAASVSTLKKFTNTTGQLEGRSPYGSLVEVRNGGSSVMYGTTYRGGTDDKGVLFSITPSGSFTKLDDFTGTTGVNPAASLVAVNFTVTPVTFSNFTARAQNATVQLAWEVHTEYDIEKYEIERSTDGIVFTSIGMVTAINSAARHGYNYTDAQPGAGTNYYRLKIHEKYKAAHYSPIKVVQMAIAGIEATVRPNPITDASRLHLRLGAKSRVQMLLYNAQGVQVKQWAAQNLDKGEHYLPLQLGNLAAGSYVLVVDAENNKQTLQLIKAGN